MNLRSALFAPIFVVFAAGCGQTKKKESTAPETPTPPASAKNYVDLDVEKIMKFNLPVDESDGKFALSATGSRSSDACQLNQQIDSLKNKVVENFGGNTFCDGTKKEYNVKYQFKIKDSPNEPERISIVRNGNKVYMTFCSTYKGETFTNTFKIMMLFDLTEEARESVTSWYSSKVDGGTSDGDKQMSSITFKRTDADTVEFDNLMTSESKSQAREVFSGESAIAPDSGFFKMGSVYNGNATRDLFKYVVLNDQVERGLGRHIRKTPETSDDRTFSLQGYNVVKTDYPQYASGGALDIGESDLPSIDPEMVIAEPEGFWDCENPEAVLEMTCEFKNSVTAARNCGFESPGVN